MIDRLHAFGKTIALPSPTRCQARSARSNGTYLAYETPGPSNGDARRVWRQRLYSPRRTPQLHHATCLQPPRRMRPAASVYVTTGMSRRYTTISAAVSEPNGDSNSADSSDLAASLAGSRHGDSASAGSRDYIIPASSVDGPKGGINRGSSGDGDGKDPPSVARLASGGNGDSSGSWGLIAQIAVLLGALFVVARLVGDHDSTPRRSSVGRRSTFRRLKSVFTPQNRER